MQRSGPPHSCTAATAAMLDWPPRATGRPAAIRRGTAAAALCGGQDCPVAVCQAGPSNGLLRHGAGASLLRDGGAAAETSPGAPWPIKYGVFLQKILTRATGTAAPLRRPHQVHRARLGGHGVRPGPARTGQGVEILGVQSRPESLDGGLAATAAAARRRPEN